MVRFVHKQQLGKASQLCLTLAADGVELPDVYADESAVIERATAALKRKRLELQGRNRAQLILNSGGVSGKSQESKQRAATKRDINAVMERSVRGAVASVTVGAGDAAEVLTDPLEVARECCEWSDRRMSLMQPKWFLGAWTWRWGTQSGWLAMCRSLAGLCGLSTMMGTAQYSPMREPRSVACAGRTCA